MSETPTQPAWTDRDLADSPHGVADKARRVERMFAAIAPSYDLNNRLHSMWRDQAWRRAAVRMAEPKSTDVVLDVACGTGDLAMAFSDANVRRVIGVDFTVNMLQIARQKRPTLDYQAGDAMHLPIAEASVDIVSIAFGIRNVSEPAVALAEFYRVLRPEGRLIILEFSQPTNPVLRGLDRIYREKIMPVTATWIAHDRSGAYRYLPKSVSTFSDRQGMVRQMHETGFDNVTYKPLTFGIAVCYRGVKTRD